MYSYHASILMWEYIVRKEKKIKGGFLFMYKMLTITEVAKKLEITPKTIKRWEKSGKVKKPKRNYRGWRVYDQADTEELIERHSD